MFLHLSSADLISGIDATGATPVTYGKALPAVKAGGGLYVGTAASGTDAVTSGTLTTGYTYALMTADATDEATGVLSGTTAAQIDRKLDDGQPRTGSVQGTAGTCVNSATPAGYDEAVGAGCVLAARVLN